MNGRSPFANRRAAGAAVVSGLLLVPLGVFGGSALAHSGGPSAAQYQYKVSICHHTGSKKHPWHLIRISNRAVRAHLKHGDVMAPCPTTALTTKHDHGKPATVTTTSQSIATQDDDGHDGHGHGGHDNGHHGKS
jgi:hypothetical protein